MSAEILRNLTWLRISMNRFAHWDKKIGVPVERVGPETTIGMSVCFSGDNKDIEFLRDVAR